jgi:VWFA-related protein
MTACQIPRRVKFLPIAIGIFLISAWAQAPQPASEIPQPAIRVTTHMVLVDVVVTDKQGKAVTGLHPGDFVIEENGKGQKIVSLSAPNSSALTAPPVLPPGIYSNRSQYRSPGNAVTVMLLDALKTPFADQAYARRQMLEFVREQFKPGERMAVFALTGRLSVLQDFTSDPQILYAALQHYKPQTRSLESSTQPGTSASAGPATVGSTVTSLDASSQPPSDSGGDAGVSGLRGGGAASAAITNAEAALQAFEGAQVSYAKEQDAVLAWHESWEDFPVGKR